MSYCSTKLKFANKWIIDHPYIVVISITCIISFITIFVPIYFRVDYDNSYSLYDGYIKDIHKNNYKCSEISSCECRKGNINSINTCTTNIRHVYSGVCYKDESCCPKRRRLSIYGTNNYYHPTSSCGSIDYIICNTIVGNCSRPVVDIVYFIENEKYTTSITTDCPIDIHKCLY